MDDHTTTTSLGGSPRRTPPVEPFDLDPARRPGVPMHRPPQPWPNSRFPPARMQARPASLLHGRPHKQMPPVYSTAVPPRGVSGALRRAAYRIPDHDPNHWVMLLLADRVDAWGARGWKLVRAVAPLALVAFAGARVLGGSRR
jgi:hypothetical protein